VGRIRSEIDTLAAPVNINPEESWTTQTAKLRAVSTDDVQRSIGWQRLR
jgi:hypothetical protein